MPLLSLSYDRYNRLYQAVQIDSGTEQYFYNTASHQRIWKRFPNGDKEFYFYGPGGQRLSAMRYVPGGAILSQRHWLYFAGRAVRVQEAVNPNHLRPPTGQALVADRLGSVRIMAGVASTTTMDYYPYGEERTPTASDKDKFGTYYRDAATGLDYANNRYYASQMARFLTPDPHIASAWASDPQSWNRYTYVLNDPMNSNDPSGLEPTVPEPDPIPPKPPVPDFTDLFRLMFWNPNLRQQQLLKIMTKSTGEEGNPKIDLVGDLFALSRRVLIGLGQEFAAGLRAESVSGPCTAIVAALSGVGVTAEKWANALENVSVLNGPKSAYPLYLTLPYGSDERQEATLANLTVSDQFGPGTVAVANSNGNQVWINPLLVNPGDTQNNAALIAHETLHNLGLTDTQIQQALGLEVTGVTHNISAKLGSDCFSGLPNGILLP